jgi:translation initiation factor IF-1
MPREDLVEIDGIIAKALGGGFYEIETGGNGIRAKLSGKMKMNKIRVLPGDSVTVGVSPVDLTLGIIVRRHRGNGGR